MRGSRDPEGQGQSFRATYPCPGPASLAFRTIHCLTTALGVFAAILLLSGVASWLETTRDGQIKAAVASEERRRWLDQGEKDPHSAAHYSIYAFTPARALAAIDPGVMPFVGEAVWAESHLQNDLLFRSQQDANTFERLGLVDPAGLFVRFGTLAVFLVAFAAVAPDRQNGILQLVSGIAATRGTYLGAKVTSVVALGAAALVLPVTLAGALGVVSAGGRRDRR